MINCQFELNERYIKRLANVSYYNHNYYELDLSKCGDFVIPKKCNILYVESDEFYNVDTYSLGYFENNKFVACFAWINELQDFIGIKEKEQENE